MFLIDTDTVRLILDGNPVVTRRVSATPGHHIWLSAVSVEEMLRGRLAEISDAREGKSRVSLGTAYEWLFETLNDLRRFNLFPYTEEAEAQYRSFPASVKRIGKQDARIAALAIVSGLTLVTRNTTHFEQVPGLPLTDWLAEENGSANGA